MSRMLQLWSTAVHNTSELAPMPSCTGTFPTGSATDVSLLKPPEWVPSDVRVGGRRLAVCPFNGDAVLTHHRHEASYGEEDRDGGKAVRYC